MSSLQYRATGQCLLRAFPNKPRSSVAVQYNNAYIFNELDKVNSLRNRIAHHEPICFRFQASCIRNRHKLHRQWIPENSDFIFVDGYWFTFNALWAWPCAKCLCQDKQFKRVIIEPDYEQRQEWLFPPFQRGEPHCQGELIRPSLPR